MKNNKLIVILLLSIIILQNIGLFISKQEKLKSTIRDTEMYINGAASEINDLINLNINDKSSSEDIERFNQIISFCKYDMFLGDKSLDGYRINVDSELNDFFEYSSQHSTILDEISKDQEVEPLEKEYLKSFEKELKAYSLELKKLQDKKFVSVKEVNNITSNFDVTYKHDIPQHFFYVEEYKDFINNTNLK